MSSFQRVPAKERMIGEIASGDTRVSIVGAVVGLKENILAIDDGTGRISATFDPMPDLKAGQFVRVFGRLIPFESGLELQGEAINDFSGADIQLWRKAGGLWGRSLGQL